MIYIYQKWKKIDRLGGPSQHCCRLKSPHRIRQYPLVVTGPHVTECYLIATDSSPGHLPAGSPPPPTRITTSACPTSPPPHSHRDLPLSTTGPSLHATEHSHHWSH
ncbi:hypothetical protein DPEC_G00126110 [Dallia pectoralis]|uniref:Uncharacterized protein n=1 Tax=Dallia pectoralis TaxID=75939 RepID=A0ACC2GRC5_DALPE|nr:hypothetical protein DPEC_G00126110 [Dallia pectoralis]